MSATAEMTCRELVELVTDYLEDALTPERRALFDGHLAACDRCATYLEQMRVTRHALGTLTERTIAPEARDALLYAFRGWGR